MHRLIFSTAIIATAACPACGRWDPKAYSGRQRPTNAPMPIASAVPTPAPPPPSPPAVKPAGHLKALDDLPVETFVTLAGSLPARIAATELTVHFRSNIQDAVFECRRRRGESFAPCPDGDSYTFEGLKHGQSHELSVRAALVNGRVDLTPATVAFLVDQVDGERFDAGDERRPPALKRGNRAVTAASLPRVQAPDAPRNETTTNQPEAPGKTHANDRLVQVGDFYAAVVPYDMLVASYSSSKSYNGRLHLLRSLDGNAGAAYAGAACGGHPWERIVAVPGGSYCEGTPTRTEIVSAYSRPMPFNHVELGSASGGEKILVAAFDDDTDPLESRLGLGGVCQRGTSVPGDADVPALREFLEPLPRREKFTWCQVRGTDGRWWWVGAFTGALGAGSGSPRVKVIYSVTAEHGIVSGRQFAERASRLLPNIIVPITAAPRRGDSGI